MHARKHCEFCFVETLPTVEMVCHFSDRFRPLQLDLVPFGAVLDLGGTGHAKADVHVGRFELGGGHRFTQEVHVDGQTAEGVPELVELFPAHNLERFNHAVATNHGGGGPQRRNDFACNQFGFESRALFDAVVVASHTRGLVNEVDVVVAVVVFFKSDHIESRLSVCYGFQLLFVFLDEIRVFVVVRPDFFSFAVEFLAEFIYLLVIEVVFS